MGLNTKRVSKFPPLPVPESLFVIVGQDDIPLYMTHFGTEPNKDGLPLNELFLQSSLDVVEAKVWSTQSNNLKIVDRFNNLNVSAYVTPSHAKFLLLHSDLNEDGIKAFFYSVHSLFIKILLNPFYEPNMPISDLKFDMNIRLAGEKLNK